MSGLQLHALPGKAPAGGYVYAALYSVGVMKVGRTKQPRQRFSVHKQIGEAFGATITRVWLSPLHLDYNTTEQQVLDQAEHLCTSIYLSEYFRGVDFDELTSFAEALHYAPMPAATPRFVHPEPFLDIDQAAERLRVDREYLRARVKAHTVPFCKFGRHIRFTNDQVAAINAKLVRA